MSLPVKLICRANKVNADRTCSIFVQYYCNEKHKPLFGTDVKIPPCFWEESDAPYLTYEEIAQIYQNDLSAYPQLIEYWGLFVVACLAGLRFSDFSTLLPEDLQWDMLYKKQEKSDHWVIIPLRQEAKI